MPRHDSFQAWADEFRRAGLEADQRWAAASRSAELPSARRDYLRLYFAANPVEWTVAPSMAIRAGYALGWDDERIQRAIDAGVAAGYFDRD